jgi:hypothetical protein
LYWLDYSAAKLSGATIKSAGYGGVIRYIDAPNLLSTKHTNLAEYRDHLAAGLTVRLVHQGTTTDADAGFQGGVNRATRAKAGADYLGYTGVIFFTNDRTTVPNPSAWTAYLDGAASVLGRERVGAYGFANALNYAKGHASAFWQAGRRSDLVPHANFWQDNNTQVTVGGVLCDRNLVIADYTPEDDMTPQEFLDTKVRWWDGHEVAVKDILAEVFVAARGLGGKPAFADQKAAVQLPPLVDIKTAVAAPAQATVDLDALAAKVAALAPVIDYAALAKAVNDDLHNRTAE